MKTNRALAFIINGLLISSPVFLQAIASNSYEQNNNAQISFSGQSNSASANQKSKPGKLAVAKSTFVINAPISAVWKILIDFPQYPNIFHKIQSCRIVKQDEHFIWTESELKPHAFIHDLQQHAVNDISGKPNELNWTLLDGCFKTAIGKWQLKPGNNNTCSVTYTLSVDLGPMIPHFLISFVLRNMEKEITSSFKNWVEANKQAYINGQKLGQTTEEITE